MWKVRYTVQTAGFGARTVQSLFKQLLCWLIFIGYELFLSSYLAHVPVNLFNVVIFYSINITLFYTHLYVLDHIPAGKLFKTWPWFLLIVPEIACFLAFKLAADGLILHGSRFWADPMRIAPYAGYDMGRCFYFVALATFYWAVRRNGRLREEAVLLNVRLSEARNAYLQQQIQPHLLFNTLNFVYNQVFRESAEAADSVLLLSDILRFSLQPTGADGKVPVAAELDQLRKLIAINRYRFESELSLEFEISGDFTQGRIIPLILLTLTENIFKHGRLDEPARPARLHIGLERGTLRFESRNHKRQRGVRAGDTVGLANVRLRLDYAYAHHYRLTIEEDDEQFILDLTIRL